MDKITLLSNKHSKIELDKLFDNNQITEKEYNKAILELSYDYCINGFPNDSLNILLFIKKNNFKFDLIEFLNDDTFMHQCIFILDMLYFLDIIEVNVIADIMSTQACAEA